MMMAAQYLPSYFRLSSRAIAEVISDVEHRRDGADIFFVIDPFDLIEFCFPIDPASQRQPDIGAISDDQTALFEIFLRRKQAPLLIREYEGEVSVHSSYLEGEAEEAYDKTEILTHFLRHLNIQGAAIESDEKLIKLLQREFSVILAVLMGIYSFGVRRFRTIVGSRLWRETNLAHSPLGRVDSKVIEAFSATTVTPLYSELKEFLFSLIPEQELKSTLARRRQAAENDAHVVDRLLQVNIFLEKAFQAGELTRRKLFLYLSSAERSEAMFTRGPATTAKLPVIDDEPFNIWRSRSQVFASLIFRRQLGKEKEDTPEDYDALAHNLRKFQELVRPMENLYPLSIRSSPTKCDTCFLKYGNQWHYKPSYMEVCPWSDLCRHVTRLSFDKQATELQNLGLLTNVQRYAGLLDASAKTSDSRELTSLFRRIIGSPEIIDIALTRLQDVQEQIATRSEFAYLMSVGIEVGRDDVGGVSGTEELVTSPIQTLPIALQLQEQRYIDIVTNFVRGYTGSRSARVKTDLLIDSYKKFLSHEKQSVLSSPEHELVRCLLYLAFETNAGRQLAVKHVSIITDKFKEHAGYLQECHYILLWALRKNGLFEQAERLAKDVLLNNPDDPRIWHGRLLNGYEWITSSGRACNLKTADLFQIGEATLERHQAAKGKLRISDHLHQLLMLVLLNDVSFIYVLDENENNVDKAKSYLAKLKELCPANLWSENNPEFLHTEAMVIYREVCKTQSAEGLAKLKITLRNLETAIDVFPKSESKELAEKIQILLEKSRIESRKAD